MPSSNAVEPGTRLVDRYRLEESLGQAGGTTYWRAHDELLDRPVGVCLLRDDSRRAGQVLRAARRAAAVTDPRFLRVLDASQVDGAVYVVNEWIQAETLADSLADGPLPPARARSLVAEVAAALGSAHHEGLAHLCLQPEHILCTNQGQVKVAGLAVDAAVRGLEVADAAQAAERDTRGCGEILYAALTARWPGEQPSGLDPAPYDGTELCSPRQVRAGVPDDLDALTCRALGTRSRRGSPLTRPEALADALGAAHVTTRIPTVSDDRPSGADDGTGFVAAYEDQGRRRSVATVLAFVAVALVLVVGLGLAGWQLLHAVSGGSSGNTSGTGGHAGNQPGKTPAKPYTVSQVTTIDPGANGDGEENTDLAGRVVDGNPATVWTTKDYQDQFGTGYKNGVGLVLDLGKSRPVREVRVTVAGPTGVDLGVSDQGGASRSDYRTVANGTGPSTITLRPPSAVSGRYVLVWLRSLPQVGGLYRGTVSEVQVLG
ncbi:MAG: hypothetical protein QOJ60_55 [Actinomycetota bacterium]|nr:hypothetical protein [Actinomycetota bacterium]